MPELPEAQALSERIDERLGGATLVRLEPLAFSALKTVLPPPEELYGHVLVGVGRRGKFLIFDFATARLLVHLSQGGRVDFEEAKKSTRPRGGVLRMTFDRLPAVLVKEFGTERKAGWWVLPADEDGPLSKLGPDPFSEEFAELIRSGSETRRLHAMLRDQRVVAGIGRGYSD
ncbi:MAG TPA: DNA-formamidopyrimidine glycosylase family protein, partial [Actinomycetota bacterium]|nr:DNA-formamidopyrimidine glycosylase family protein [Actinomycetota bacterium]